LDYLKHLEKASNEVMTSVNPFTVALGYDTVESFKVELLRYAQSRHAMLGVALTTGVMFNAPQQEAFPDPYDYRLVRDEYKDCRRAIREIIFFVEQKMEHDLLSRVCNDDEARQWKREENLPRYWNHVLAIVEGVGGDNALGKITRLMDFKFTSEGSFQQDHHRYMAAVQTLHEYPGPEGKERFIRDVVNHHYVMKVREIPEYREFVDTQIIPLNIWPDVRGVYVSLTRQSESHRRLAKHKPEGIVNAANTFECFNCGDNNHIKTECPYSEVKCMKCRRYGHLEGFCHKFSAGRSQESPPQGKSSNREQSHRSHDETSSKRSKEWNEEEQRKEDLEDLSSMIERSSDDDLSIIYEPNELRCQDDAIEDEEMSTMEFPAEDYYLQDEYDSEDEDEEIVVSSYSSRVYSTNSRST
jgi:hypothetical protein